MEESEKRKKGGKRVRRKEKNTQNKPVETREGGKQRARGRQEAMRGKDRKSSREGQNQRV